jgi:hypothetical protein
MDFEALKGLLRRVAEEVEAEIKQVERELAEARRVGARARELAAVRDILYEDKWFRIATAVYAQIKRQFAEDAKADELIEAAVDQDGRVAAVRCKAPLDVGVEAVFEGVAEGVGRRGGWRRGRGEDRNRRRGGR